MQTVNDESLKNMLRNYWFLNEIDQLKLKAVLGIEFHEKYGRQK